MITFFSPGDTYYEQQDMRVKLIKAKDSDTKSNGDDLPFRELWAAVFFRAMEDLFLSGQSDEDLRTRSSAWRWLKSNRDSLGSFIYLCNLFGLDPTAGRRVVRKFSVHADPAWTQPEAKGEQKRLAPPVQHQTLAEDADLAPEAQPAVRLLRETRHDRRRYGG